MFEFLMLSAFAFAAGFIDAVVGGGGLVQVPGMLITLPNLRVPLLLGTGKVAAFVGTSMSAYQYGRLIKFDKELLLSMAISAGLSAFIGARLMSFLPTPTMKPIILCLLFVVFMHTLLRKEFGSIEVKKEYRKGQRIGLGILVGLVIGFYDGFFGPGTGTFLVLAFISLLGFDFLRASAHAKVVNMATNLSAISYFVWTGNIIWKYAFVMALCNLSGSYFGSKMALAKGNIFVRRFFLLVILGTMLRFGWDVFKV
jgi:uncharacterized protein